MKVDSPPLKYTNGMRMIPSSMPPHTDLICKFEFINLYLSMFQ